jgi:hypothetical protein
VAPRAPEIQSDRKLEKFADLFRREDLQIDFGLLLDEICAPFLHVFEVVVVHDKAVDYNGNNPVSIHEHHRPVLFESIVD